MLYHVPNLERGIAELARVLRPGGRLVAVTNSRFHLIELRELVGSGPSTAQLLAGERRGTAERVVRARLAHRHRRDARVRRSGRGRGVRPSLDLDVAVRREPARRDRRAARREARQLDLRGGDGVIDDPEDVAKQYANEANLRARQALWEEVEGENTPLLLVAHDRRVGAEARPRGRRRPGRAGGADAGRARRPRDLPRPIGADGRAGARARDRRRARRRRPGAAVPRRVVRHGCRGVDALPRARSRPRARRDRARPQAGRGIDRRDELGPSHSRSCPSSASGCRVSI